MMLLWRVHIFLDLADYNIAWLYEFVDKEWVYELIDKESCLTNNVGDCALDVILRKSEKCGKNPFANDVIARLIEREGHMMHITQ